MENNLPNHIAIIPDANRRWARERGIPPWKGHEAGAENFEKLISYSLKKGIQCLSIWGSSIDNLTKRPLEEKKALLDIYKKYFTKMLEGKEIIENEARVNFIGRWEDQFPDSLKKIIYEVIEKTKNYQKRILNFMLAYNGTDDMLSAIEKINAKYEKGIKITAEVIKENLMTANIPAVDFVIRTGGEPHNSAGFMMWDTADAQLYFSPEKFPDFNEEKFQEALEEYARRQRRFGV
ncbi:MAG TPA: di-trans,poly-cis-decaprenylcistransferase [Candidatus Moranbacteria bacterium]|nr:di-trans,poly-cis-decaprenylcistransferase [Candidatus Moranbacteria bacterium]HAT74877.1 di-trans,poly-cis-decaprenylcistransferase [Candidatus Moranbacteria bacterium]